MNIFSLSQTANMRFGKAAFSMSQAVEKKPYRSYKAIGRLSGLLMVLFFLNNGYVLAQQAVPPSKFEVDGNLRTGQKLFVGMADDSLLTSLIDTGQYALYVNGTVLATKLVVKKYGDWWPDYVFDSSYSLMPLPALKNYITLNKHLPGVVSAGEVEKKGVDVADTQAVLLHKIEELTLYILQQQKEISMQNDIEKAMQLKIKNLEKSIEQLRVIK